MLHLRKKGILQLKKCIVRIESALKEIYYLAQGGTAVGTGLNTKKNFLT